jgi:hypothetical protein
MVRIVVEVLNRRGKKVPFSSLHAIDQLKHRIILSLDIFWLIDIQPKMVNVRHESITLGKDFSDERRLKKLADDWIFH